MSTKYPPSFVTALDGEIGHHIKIRRKNLGLNQLTVVLQMEVAYGFRWLQSHLSKVEAGDRMVKLSEAFALASILNIDLVDLARGEALDEDLSANLVFPDTDWPDGDDGVDN